MFRDITPVLGEPGLVSSITDRFVTDLHQLGWEPDLVVGPEARGFIFGPLARRSPRLRFRSRPEAGETTIFHKASRVLS